MSTEMASINATIPSPATTEQSFKCVHIRHRYSENTPSNHVKYASIEALHEAIWDPEDCVYEVLDKPERKIYIDIEGIDKDEEESHKLVLKLILNFCKFIGLTAIGITHVTYNAGSTGHPGRSYHVIIDYAINYQLLKNVLIAFKQLHPEYGMYIDESVYSVIRLFRLPYQCKQRADDTPDSNDVHIPINIFAQDTTDEQYHSVDYFSEFVIQNLEDTHDTITVADLPDEAIRQIGMITLESKQSPLTNPYKSGGLRTTQFIEAITAQMNDVKESNASLTRQVAELTKINEKLFSALSHILGQRNISLDDN